MFTPTRQIIRTFIAVEIPDGIKAAMRDIQSDLRKSGADVGWARPEGVHLTLKFLGDVEADAIPRLAAELGVALSGMRPFTLSVGGTGVFPTPKSPRVVWLGLGGDMDALGAAQKAVEAVCGGFGFKPEDRPFRPHLTLGRVKSAKGRDALIKALALHENAELGTFTAGSVSVMKSELKPSGAVYTEMHKINLPKEI